MQNTVNVNRDRYIGGSDVPIIMGISPFKSRFRLLQEKALIVENEFEGNEYTKFGNELEPKIRNYINSGMDDCYFVEGKHYAGDIRIHTDGEDEFVENVLEIKTTSHIYDDVRKYKVYLVQLLFYLDVLGWKEGLLAVYERPAQLDKFSYRFDATRLHLYPVNVADYEDLIEEIRREVDRFRIDLKRIKDNPFLTESDFFPDDVQELANELVKYEEQAKIIEESFYASKAVIEKKLSDALQTNKLKKCTGFRGWTFSLTPKGNIKSSHKEAY